jgi:tetratricopeptide (TPR) repeat protein
VQAWEALAETLCAIGEATLAIRALDTAAELHGQAGDRLGEARAHVRVADVWQRDGNGERADVRYRRALELAPDYPPALEGAARAATDTGDHTRAAELWEQLLRTGGLDPGERAQLLCELGRSLLRAGDADAAREPLREAANAAAGRASAEAWAALAELDESAGARDDAADAYAMAVAELGGADDDFERLSPGERARCAALSLARARLLDSADDYALAHALDPRGEAGRAAARALYDAAVRDGDTDQARRWIDALVTAGMPADEEIEARLARAELEMRAGDTDAATIDLERVSGGRLAASLDDAARSRVLWLQAALAESGGDAVGRARALTDRAEQLSKSSTAGAALAALADAAEAWLAADDSEQALYAARRAAVHASEGDVADAAVRARVFLALGAAAWRRRAWADVARAYGALLERGDAPSSDRAVYAHRLGIALDKQGDLDGAVAALARVVEEADAAGEALATSWRVLAGLHERLGDSLRAADAFELFAADERTDAPDAVRADAWYRAGELYRKQPDGSRAHDAERCLEGALRLAADHLPALDALERLKSTEKDWERVSVILGRKIAATARQPSHQKALLARLADLQAERLERRDVALETYRRALEIDAEFRPALRYVADDARERGAIDEAVAAYATLARVLDADDDLDDDEVLAAERVSSALAMATLLIDAGRGAEAVEPLRALTGKDTGVDDRVLEALANAHRAAEQWTEAADVLGRLAASASDTHLALQSDLQRIAIFGSHIDDAGAAWAACKAALSRHPDEPALLATSLALARTNAAADDLADVLAAAADNPKACQLADSSAADLFVEAADLCARELEQPERATDLYRRALHVEPSHPAALSGLGDTGVHEAVPEAVLDTEISGAIDTARARLDDHDLAGALAVLEAAGDAGAPAELLLLRAELLEATEEWERAAEDLQGIRALAAAEGDAAVEHQITRRLAALTLERLHDDVTAARLYERALELDVDDLAAAEALSGIYGRRRDRAHQVRALEQVLGIARRTCAGPSREASILRELATISRADRRLDRAAEYLDEARAVAPYDLHALRARAELAVELEDYETCAECLERLAGRLTSTSDDDEPPELGRAASAGDVLIELATVYTEMLGDPARGRATMHRAAQSFGATPRGDAALRMLAAQALGDEDDEEVAAALEHIAPGRRTQSDLLNLAKALKRLGRDRRAIATLEDARARGPLPDEAAMLLFALHRELQRKAQLATSLEKGAYEQPPEVARTRLREALIIYEQSLEDDANAERVRARLDEYAPTFTPDDDEQAPRPAAPAATSDAELVRAAEEALASGDTATASELLAQAIAARARDLDVAGSPLDARARDITRRLREVARGGGHYESLARGMLVAAVVEPDAARRMGMLREIAAIRLAHLHDGRGAADALSRALALAPADPELFAELDSALREIGDLTQLAAAYDLHLSALAGEARVEPLRELAKITRDLFADDARADALLAEARSLAGDPEPEPETSRTGAADDALRIARELESRGQMVAAISQYESASAADPYDDRPLIALERIYAERGDTDALTEILGRQIVAAASGRERARLWYRRAMLYRDVLHREPETYRCLKEAYANDPNSRDAAYALRSISMARGEWGLAAELLYREIDAAPNTTEAAALHLELALIYDEKLIDAGQARVNYEQALALDPDIPAAPGPLARLYELAGRHEDAAAMGEQAARFARDDDTRSKLLRRAAACAERAGKKDDARRLFGLSAMFAADAADSNAAHASVARLSSDPSDRLAQLELLEMRLSEADTPELQQDLRHQLLDLAVAAGETATIRRHAGVLLEEEPADLSAFLALKRAAAAVGDWSILAYLLRTRAGAVDDRVERAALFYELGRLCLDRLEDTGGAISAFEQALSADPRHPAVLEALADIAYQKNDWDRARELYARLRPETCSLPADVLAYRRGEISEALGDLDEAAAAYAEAVKVCASNRMALSALSRAALQLGDLETAVDASRAMADFMPPDDLGGIVSARLQVADLSRRAGIPDVAAEYYEAVLSEDPRNLNALAPLPDLYRTLERWDDLAEALSSLAALASSAKERASLLYRLGEVYREHLGNEDRATESYLRAIDLDPRSEPTLRRLVDYYAGVDDTANAMDVIRELSGLGALFSPATGASTLARALIVAARSGEAGLALQLGERLGDAAPLAIAMAEAAGRDAGAIPDLVKTAKTIARAHSVIRVADLTGAISKLASHHPGAEALANALNEDH